jgi:hypothetical protein
MFGSARFQRAAFGILPNGGRRWRDFHSITNARRQDAGDYTLEARRHDMGNSWRGVSVMTWVTVSLVRWGRKEDALENLITA